MQGEARDETAGEDLSALILRVLAETGRSQTWLAGRADIPLASLNAWVRRARGTAGIDPDVLRRLADALGLTPAAVFAAAGRRVPAALNEEREKKMLRLFRELPTAQQRLLVQQAEAMVRIARAS
ncbi:transcriptional regulator [Kitasatospora sp. NPDC091335]|uniref:transcriptional regulator n=1 Tax=Kitasatospora sp. NPDC091335 TaxID=3364085 RepID=UPI0037F31ADD